MNAGFDYNPMVVSTPAKKAILIIVAIVVGLLVADAAQAFRCKSKLVSDGMHEQQVLAICGKPTTMRHLGYTLRSVDVRVRSPGGFHRRHTFGHLTQEVLVTEYVYNVGPRRLMRRLIFEGGVLVSIDTIGYGYHEKRAK